MEKPKNFYDLLKLQNVLDEQIEKERKNGFVPRERTEQDILLALDDEFQEWLKELPQEYNFKTWKQKKYSRERELEELTDVLFFFLQYFNKFKMDNSKNNLIFKNFEESNKYDLKEEISDFKFNLWVVEVHFTFKIYISLVITRRFTKEDLLNMYWEKWQTNMKRINEDWSIKNEKN